MKQTPTDNRQAGFGVRRPRDMRAKLDRELSRVSLNTAIPEDLQDHGINCAFTAWHIYDWVWRVRFEKDEKAQQVLWDRIPEVTTADPEKHFKDYMTNACPELALCQDITNGVKHVVASVPRGRKAPAAEDVTTSAASVASGAFTEEGGVIGGCLSGGAGAFTGHTDYKLKIIPEDGKRRDAIEVFQTVREFWTEFMDEFGMS
jgi:hypothetical protein